MAICLLQRKLVILCPFVCDHIPYTPQGGLHAKKSLGQNQMLKSDIKCKNVNWNMRQSNSFQCLYLLHHCGEQQNWARTRWELPAIENTNQEIEIKPRPARCSTNSSSDLVLCKGAVTLVLHSHELQKSFLESKGILGFCPQTSRHSNFEDMSNKSNSRSRKRVRALWHSLFLLRVKCPLTFPIQMSNAERLWAPIIFTTINLWKFHTFKDLTERIPTGEGVGGSGFWHANQKWVFWGKRPTD